MKKSEKIFFVENLAAHLKDAKSVVLLDPSGLKVNQQQDLRRRLREVGAAIMVVKNTLLERALRQVTNLKSQITNLKPGLTGQTAVVLATDDELAPLQVLGKFIREFELPRFKMGIIGDKTYGEAELGAISKIPGKEVLLSQLVGNLAGSMYQLVGTLQANMGNLVNILNVKSKGGES